MKRLAVAFSGSSGSGKTTLIAKIAKILIKDGYKVVIIKHDPADKAKFDKEGKDSFLFSSIGANVGIISSERTTLFLNSGLFGEKERINSKEHKEKNENFASNAKDYNQDLQKLISYFEDFDYLIIEGLKHIPLPRVTIFRNTIDERYLPFSDAIASDLKCIFDKPAYKLDDISGIISWINTNAKKV